MIDGWHKITNKWGEQVVQYIHRNNAQGASVARLLDQGCLFQPVLVLTEGELNELLENALKKQKEAASAQ
jgi:hypothetical protein